jgi:NADH:ubiquinone reductase (H+-translocating)
MRGFPAWMVHRTYHLLKLPTMNRRLRVVSDWTLALLFRREVVSLDVLEHPREEFQAALHASADGIPGARPSPDGEQKGADDDVSRKRTA